MYNVEKYVGQCLGSLLSQTFQDFEVIVVDDCSTDNSIEVVKKYIPNFKNRLQIIKLDKNSGNAALPRNMGLRLSRGKYIWCKNIFFCKAETIKTKRHIFRKKHFRKFYIIFI